MILLKLQTGVRSHFVTRMPEWGLSIVMFASAVQLLRTGETFSSSNLYTVLARHIDEEHLGTIAAVISSAWLGALIVNGSFRATRRWSPWVRSSCAMLSAMYWMVVALAIAAADSLSTGVVNNAGFSFLALAASILSAREVGAADRNAKKCRSPKLPTIG